MRYKRLEFAIRFGCSPFRMAPHNPRMVFAFALPFIALLALSVLALAGDRLTEIGPAFVLLGQMKELVEKRKELEAKSGILHKIFEEAGSEIALSKVKRFGEEDVSALTPAQKAEKIKKLNQELADIGKEVEQLVEVERAKGNVEDWRSKFTQKSNAIVHPHATDPNSPRAQLKTLGQLVTESNQFKRWHEAAKSGEKTPLGLYFDVYPSELLTAHELKSGHYSMKTLFQTSAGWDPESTRIGRVIDAVSRPIQVLDIVPMERTGQAAVIFMEETTRTHGAAEKAEAAAYAESTFVLAEKSSTVRKITDSIPVTDEQLDDVPLVESYLNNRLIFGVRQRLDGQVLTGDGVAPNLKGILNVTGIQTQAKGTDPTPDAIFKAMTKVRVTGRAEPDFVVLHPNDWEAIRLLRDANGNYIFGSPNDPGMSRIWGKPVVVADAETENTGLVGSFGLWCAIFERRGVEVQVGFVGSDFTQGKKTMRADMRAAFVVFRPAAFATITGI